MSPVRSACKEEQEASYHSSENGCAYMLSRYSIVGAHIVEPEELGKGRPTTLLWFARASKRFSWPLVILGLRTGPNIQWPHHWVALPVCPEGKGKGKGKGKATGCLMTVK